MGGPNSGQERLQVTSLFAGTALRGPGPSEAVREAATVPLQKYNPCLLQGRHEHPPSHGHHQQQAGSCPPAGTFSADI